MKATALLRALTKSPILWGVLASIGFFSLIHAGPLGTPFIKRYFTNHPVEYAETVLFAVGLAVLVLKIADLAGQYPGLRTSPLDPARARAAEPIDGQCAALLRQLDRLPERRQADCYTRRLRAAVEHVRDRGAAHSLDDQLKYLADLDASRAYASYGLFRVIIWAIPILGFLGTVIGITIALNSLDPRDIEQSMIQVITGLGLKFDTTALGLMLSMLLMFGHFFVERGENALLQQVDQQVEADVVGRFPQLPSGTEGQLVAVRRMVESIVEMSQQLVRRQAELWQGSMEAAATRWTRMADTASEQVKKGLSAALSEGLKTYAQQLAGHEQAAAAESRRHWEKLQQTQAENVQTIAALQAGVTQQTEVLGRAIEATGEVMRLQDVLNRNLAALAGAGHFEQTVNSLAAAIHLLNARLSETPVAVASVQLESPKRKVLAA